VEREGERDLEKLTVGAKPAFRDEFIGVVP
jgi:hypothetical protein